MVKRLEKVEKTRRRIAKATYELHSTIGPALTTIALISDRSGLPRQTVYRNFGTQVELFRSCIAFGQELHPIPDPRPWKSISDPGERLQVGLTQLYRWFEASEPVLTNAARDFGVVREAAEVAQQPIDEVRRRIYATLSHGLAGLKVAPVLSLAVDFATWKKLRREQGMASTAIVEMWLELIRCPHADRGQTRVRAMGPLRKSGRVRV